LRCIRDNLARVTRALGDAPAPDVRVLPLDVARLPERAPEFGNCLDLVLADPPYAEPANRFGAAALLGSATFADWAGGALLVLEHDTHATLPWAPRGRWRLLRQRRFGGTVLSFARRDDPPLNDSTIRTA
jgi:16S rRNA G966 N2-methylase RsmD